MRLTPICAAVALAMLSLHPAWTGEAHAGPTGGALAAGSATIQQNANSTVIQQSTPRAVLNWQGFSIGAGESVVFRQPSSSAVALNRVVGPDASVISGTLQANGHVFLVNPSGVLFTRGASVDVGGLVASTLAIANDDFMSGRYVFSGGAGAGRVVNEGSIRANGGFVALLGNQVGNTGTIVANAGSVALGAGDTMLLDFGGDGLLNLKVSTAAAGAKVDHGGVIQADGGRVILSAQAKTALSATALNVDGIVRARGLAERNGEIFLDGGRSGVTRVTGALDAGSANAGQKGGEIRVLGEKVGLFGAARVDVSGAAGGGTALIGGDYQGRNPDIPNATRTIVDRSAVITADALTSGDGGKVIVWADDRTHFTGSISARGGAHSGNGGFVEISGKRTLHFAGAVDTFAPNGSVGSLLLDPTNIRVVGTAAAETANLTLVDEFTDPDLAGDGDTKIDVAAINGSAATVTLQATNDIDFDTAVNMTNAGAGLVAQAGRNINVNAGSTITTNGGVITLSARDPGTTQVAGGTVNINAALASNGGNVSVTNNGSGSPITLGANVDAASGSVTFSSAVSLTAASTVTGNGGIGFASTVDGGFALVANSTGTTSFAGAVGGTTPLASLATGAGGTTAFGPTGGSGPKTIRTSGPQTYNGNVLLNDDSTFTSTGVGAAGNVTFNGAIDPAQSLPPIGLTVNTAGTTTFGDGAGDDRIGSAARVWTLITDAPGNTVFNILPVPGNPSVRTSTTQEYNDPVLLQQGVALFSFSGSDIIFGSTVDSFAAGTPRDLIVNTTGATRFGAALGATAPLAAVTTDAGGTTAINGGLVATTGAQSYGDAVNLGANTTFTSTGGGAITFSSVLNGAFNLAANTAGTTTFAGTVGGVAPLASITTDAAGTTALDAGALSTTGTQTYNDAVTIGANATLASTGGGNIGFAGTLESPGAARSLTVNTAGTTTFGGAVGGAGNPLLSITTDAAGTSAINGGGVITTGAQTYNDPVTLGADATLTSTGGGAIAFAGTLQSPGTARSLGINTSGMTSFSGAVGSGLGTLASLTTDAAGTTAIAGGTILSNGAQIYNDAVILGADTTLTSLAGAAITFGSTVNGAFALTAGTAGATTFGGAVGNATPLASITTTLDGTMAINGGSVVTTGAQTYNDAVTLGADSTLASTGGADVTFGSTLQSPGTARSLAVNTSGTTRFAGAVGGGGNPLRSIATDAAGSTTVTGGSVSTTGAQTYNDAVTLGAHGTFASTGAGALTFASTVNGAFDLTVNSAGTTTFAAPLGTGTALASLTTDTAGGTSLNGGSVVTTGAQTYNDLLTLGANTTLTSTGAGSITLGGGVTGPFSLSANTGGTLTFGGAVDGTGTPLTSLVTDAGGSTVVLGGTITTSGVQTYNDPVSLGANATLSSTGGGAITFNSTLNGGFALTANTAGATTFSGVIGGTTPLASITTDFAGTTVINTTAITTTGAQSFNDPVTLGSGTTLTSTGAGPIAFASSLNGAFALVANTAGATSFGGPVGNTTALSSIATDAAGTTALNGGAITTTGAQTYNDAVTLGANATLASSGGGGITFGGTLDGAFALAANTAGATTFGGAVGAIGPLASVSTDAPGTTVINGGVVNTTGMQLYGDALILGANATLASSGGGAVTFGGTIDGAFALNVNTAGATTLGAAAGSTTALAALTTDAAGTTLINGGSVRTSGAQTYNDPATLGANTALASIAGGNITFGSPVQSSGAARTLTVNTGGVTTFGGAIGGAANPLAALTTDAGGSTAINGGAVSTTGAQTFGDALVLGANTTLASSGGGAVTLGSTVDGAFALNVNTAGLTALGGPIGSTTALASLTTDAPGSTAIVGSVRTTGAQTYNDPVAIAGTPVLNSTAAGITFGSTIDADAAANNRTLTVNAPAGTVTFAGNIGANQPLADFDVTASPSTIVFSGPGSQTVNVSAQGGNTATFNEPVVLATNLTVLTGGNNVTFASTIDADAFANARTLSVNSGTGTMTFGGAIGNAQPLGALTLAGSAAVLTGNVNVTGGGAVNLAGVPSATFAPGIAIDTDRTGGASAGGDVLFSTASRTNPSALDANLTIDASADGAARAGNVTLGTIGDATRLNALTVTGDTVTFGGPVHARQVFVTANTVVTPTGGQINAVQAFNNDSSQGNAALLLRGLSTPGQFGTREAPIQIDASGLFVVVPDSPNTLPFVFLAGDPNRKPVYQFADDPSHRFVFYNGAAADSPAARAAQGAVVQQIRSVLDELTLAGFAKENIRQQLLQGIVLETGLARPGIDEFVGEGVSAPPSCQPGQKGAAGGSLAC